MRYFARDKSRGRDLNWSKRSSSFTVACRSSRHAFTLLEVLVGTVLLASLVSGVLLSAGAHQSKLSFARRKTAAVKAADDLLGRWHNSATGVPLNATGLAAADGTMVWQTQVVHSRGLCEIPIHVVRLSIVGAALKKQEAVVYCQIDVVVDASRREP